ncbi:MAG: glucosaminidase domain-containing protein [Filimonas sp.]|nr:glucosaminidase domain-containing protein [Filimonas sp.]
MKRFFLLAGISLIALAGKAQKDVVQQYINSYQQIAIREMIRTGVPASITLAQGILESQSGQSDLVKRSNNHFGIKCKTEWTGEKTYHDDDEKGECFRVYPTAEESYRDHSDFLKNRPYYTFLFQLDPTDYRGWATGLKKAGYATEKKYADMLIKLIVDYNLQQYTLTALNKNYVPENNAPVLAANTSSANTQQEQAVAKASAPTTQVSTTVVMPAPKADDNKPTVSATIPEESPVKPAANGNATFIAQTKVAAPGYPTGVFAINDTRVVYAEAGTSLLALANNHNVTYSKLLSFNDVLDVRADILESGQLVYLEKKPKKGNTDFHIVKPGETMESISQTEGIKLESLLEFNRVPKGRQAVNGEKIYLRSNSPVTPKLISNNLQASTK